MESYISYYNSPIGILEIQGNENGISALSFTELNEIPAHETHESLNDCLLQLDEFFKGQRKEFSIKI